MAALPLPSQRKRQAAEDIAVNRFKWLWKAGNFSFNGTRYLLIRFRIGGMGLSSPPGPPSATVIFYGAPPKFVLVSLVPAFWAEAGGRL